MNKNGSRAGAWLVLSVAVLVLCSVWVVLNFSDVSDRPWEQDVGYNFPVYADTDAEGGVYTIDTARRRITRVQPDGTVDIELQGGDRSEHALFYAQDLAVDDSGNIYILTILNDIDGHFLEREEILRYDSRGRFVETVYRRAYGEQQHRIPALVQRGRIIGLYAAGGEVGWYVTEDTGIISMQYDAAAGEVGETGLYARSGIDMDRADVSYHPQGGFVYTTKDGLIRRVHGNGDSETLYSAPRTGLHIVPWEVTVAPDGRVYFIDLENRAVRELRGANTPRVVYDADVLAAAGIETWQFDYYRLTVGSDGSLVTTNDEAAVIIDADSGAVRYVTGGKRTLQRQLQIAATWLAVVLVVVFSLVSLRLIYVGVFNRVLPPLLIRVAAVVMIVGVSAIVVSNVIIPNLTNRYEDALLEKISQMLQVAPKTVNGDLFHEIDGLDDYNGEAYLAIREGFLETLNYNRDTWNESQYFALYREIDGRLYGFMYLNGEIGMYHPFDWIGYDGVYDHALEGQISTERTTDISGEWLYGVSPITDSNGNVVALFETGTDLYAFTLANQMLIRETALDVFTTLIIVILLMIELTFLGEMLKRRRGAAFMAHGLDPGADVPLPKDYSDAMLARPLSFLMFTAVSVSLAFMPILARGFYEPVGGLSQGFLIALPISIEMFAFGVATLLIGLITTKIGWRLPFIVGMTVLAAGLVASGMAYDMLSLNLARLVTGVGTGMAYIGLRALINLEGREDERSHSYSNFYAGMTAGVNVGVVLGASLSDRIAFSGAFYAAAGVAALALVFYFINLRRVTWLGKIEDRMATGSSLRELMVFISSPKVWLFFGLLLIPTYVAGTFLAYYFPLFAEAQGLSTSDIGRWFIINGLFIIYFGPPLSRFFKQRVGQHRAVVIGSVMWGLALLVFAVTGSLTGAIITLVVMGITEGFCVTAQNDVYLEFDVSKRLGQDRAVGYFELFGKIGEAAGPIVFSLALLLGEQFGIALLGVAVMVLALPFMLFMSQPRQRREA